MKQSCAVRLLTSSGTVLTGPGWYLGARIHATANASSATVSDDADGSAVTVLDYAPVSKDETIDISPPEAVRVERGIYVTFGGTLAYVTIWYIPD